MGYSVSVIEQDNKAAMAQCEALLKKEGISRDANIDITIGLYDDNYDLVATGSCFENTLRCLAVDGSHQGEGLMSLVVSELIDIQYSRNISHLFLYTKFDKADIFKDLGFYVIAKAGQTAVFMENKVNGFSSYLSRLYSESLSAAGEKHAAVVINANPFTLGHQYLLETAAKKCDVLHVFMVSEDSSLIPFSVREKLIREGSAHIKNIVYHKTESYMISNAVFPAYFLKDDETVIRAQADLDISVFTRIAKRLGITARYIGDEPFSSVTNIYNSVMREKLPENGIECCVIARKKVEKTAISASHVRECLKNRSFEKLKLLVPTTTYSFFTSQDAEELLDRIASCKDVFHY